MLHIILGILKIIGIFLGVILLLLLAGLLAIVFVPVRYTLSAKAQPKERYAFSLKASWFLHIVYAAATVGASQERSIVIRLFGIRLPLFRSEDDQAEDKQGRTKKKERRLNSRRENQETVQEEALEQAEIQDEDTDLADPTDSTNPTEPTESTDATDSEDSDRGEPVTSIWQKIRFQCMRICDKIKQITESLRRCLHKLVGIRQRAADLGRKGIELLHKPGELAEFLEEYEAREVFGGLIGYLVFLIAHYKPRRIKGYLRFGMDNPATTGQLTGLIYILLPARADRFSVEPVFNEPVFETELVCSGHIRVLHVLRVLWRGFRDKKLRRIINKLRKKGDS